MCCLWKMADKSTFESAPFSRKRPERKAGTPPAVALRICQSARERAGLGDGGGVGGRNQDDGSTRSEGRTPGI
jgi:hypothetical protein